MRQITQREYLMNAAQTKDADAIVKAFIAAVYEAPEGIVKDTEVPAALNEDQSFCNPQPQDPSDPDGDGGPTSDRTRLDPSRCSQVRNDIQRIAKNEMDVRILGADLQIIASSYEQAIMGSANTTVSLPERARSLAQFWRAGTPPPSPGLPLKIRTAAFPQTDAMDEAINNLTLALQPLTRGNGDKSDLIGAVWRYSLGGFRFVRKQRTDQFPPPPTPDPDDGKGTERQYLFKRWDDVENALSRIYDLTQDASAFDPPLKDGEIALFSLPEKYGKQLPANVDAWLYLEKRAGKTELTGDAGLRWIDPLDPVTPSPCKDNGPDDQSPCDPIDGGTYPPAPTMGTALCTSPLARLGYLCRPFTATIDSNVCKKNAAPQDDKIILTACTSTGTTLESKNGPDSCNDLQWRDVQPFDPQTQCKIQLTCDDSSPFTGGVTSDKDDQGLIQIKIKQKPSEPAPYVILHELIHAKQLCGLPPHTVNYPYPAPGAGATDKEKQDALMGCCTKEAEAYKTECEAMRQDVSGDMGTSKDGVPMNADTCWQILTDYSCRDRGYGSCPNTYTYNKAPTNAELTFILEFIQKVKEKNPIEIPDLCNDALTPPKGKEQDARIGAALRDLTGSGSVCTPNTTTSYENTIGNNLCQFDLCMNQSFQHRITPGLQQAGSMDTAGTVDTCLKPDPAFGAVTFVPTPAPWEPPPYRPALIAKQVDQALCTGASPQKLPGLCSFDVSQGIRSVQFNPVDIARRTLDQQSDREAAIQLVQDIADGIGSRLGTRLYVDYLSAHGRTFGELTTLASTLLSNFSKVTFPKEMCPRNGVDIQSCSQSSAGATP